MASPEFKIPMGALIGGQPQMVPVHLDDGHVLAFLATHLWAATADDADWTITECVKQAKAILDESRRQIIAAQHAGG